TSGFGLQTVGWSRAPAPARAAQPARSCGAPAALRSPITSTARRTYSLHVWRVGMLGASFPARLGLLVPTGGAHAGSVRGSGPTRIDGAQGADVSLTVGDVAGER